LLSQLRAAAFDPQHAIQAVLITIIRALATHLWDEAYASSQYNAVQQHRIMAA